MPLNATFELRGSALENHAATDPPACSGMAYDRPVVGYGAKCINTLRLWAAVAPESFDFAEFSQGDFAGAVIQNVAAESVTRVLYPDDSTEAGRTLRFLQQYFMVSCSLQDIIARFCRTGRSDWSTLPDRVAVQMNDTHPALCVAELMRILLDQAHLRWEQAWDITLRTLAYTNHTLLPEALEKWPVIVRDAHSAAARDHLRDQSPLPGRCAPPFPGDEARVQRVSLIEEAPARRVRMAHLAVVGSHSTNGVAAIHSDLLRTRVLRDFAELFPGRFNNKTNGVTPRRWLQQANPALCPR